jgi:hypothetical protein
VMGLHLLPVEAVDILTLIFKIHFNIIFLLLLACYKSSLLLRLYGFSSCGKWRCVFGCVFPSHFTRRNSHKPEGLTYPVLSPFIPISLFLCLYKPLSLGTFFCLSFNLLFLLEGVQVTAVSI